MASSHGLTAVLIAGGYSTRMGRHKALVEIGGKPLWRHQMEKLQELHPDKILFSLPTGLDGLAGPWTPVRDILPNMGPLGGLHAALHHTSTSLLVAVAIDMPDMTPAFLRGLIDDATDRCGIVPELDGFYQGLAAVYPTRIRGLVAEAIGGTDHSLQRLVRQSISAGLLCVRTVKEADRRLFRNVNQPEDLD